MQDDDRPSADVLMLPVGPAPRPVVTMPPAAARRMVSIGYAAAMTGLSDRQIIALADAGAFPRYVRVPVPKKSPALLFEEGEINRWIEDRLRERDAHSASRS